MLDQGANESPESHGHRQFPCMRPVDLTGTLENGDSGDGGYQESYPVAGVGHMPRKSECHQDGQRQGSTARSQCIDCPSGESNREDNEKMHYEFRTCSSDGLDFPLFKEGNQTESELLGRLI